MGSVEKLDAQAIYPGDFNRDLDFNVLTCISSH